MKPTTNQVPKHIGVILDGNRRFAKRLMIKPWKGHEWGAKKVEALMRWSEEIGVKELTIYALSIENLNRPKKEFDYLMKVFLDSYRKIAKDKNLIKKGLKINFIGSRYLLPKNVQDAMRNLEEKTKNNSKYIINFAMAYSGQEEIIDATKKIAEKIKSGSLSPENINKESFENNLYLKDSPDMIIRTGGEKRSSNFLPYQSVYSEWFYLEKTWPEFEKEDFLECIEQFKRRQRRFGK